MRRRCSHTESVPFSRWHMRARIAMGTNAVRYLYTPEIYPTRMRAVGTGLSTSWLRIASAIGPAVIGFMIGQGGVSAVFILVATVAVVGALASLQMIETSGRRLEGYCRVKRI
jgi:MFS transporter, putative metabolite:H+ symporter